MQCPIHRHAHQKPDVSALRAAGQAWSYGDLDEAVTATVEELASAGVTRGARVGMWMERRAESVILLWALWRRGAVAVPVSTRFPPQAVGSAVRRAGVDVFVTGDEVVAEAVPMPVVEPDVVCTSGPEAAESVELHPEADATIVFTSGSTGEPKGALHSLRNHLASADGSNANIPVAPGDAWLLSLPLYHVGGLAILFRCALGGGTVALASEDTALSSAIDRTEATHLSMVATQCRRLLDAEGWTLPGRVQAILLGGSAIPSGLLADAVERGWPIHTSYGSTEMASQVTTTSPGAGLEELQTSGRLLPYRRLRVDAAPGETGEILLAGDTLFRGYVDETGVEEPQDADGWYRSGDVGRIVLGDGGGEDGDASLGEEAEMPEGDAVLDVVGRVDRMFISGGENVQPEEIERALEQIEGVRRAEVVAVADDEFGQRPVAFVEADAHRPDAWRADLADRLARFKIPDAFHPMPETAVSGRMKVDRQRLEEEARKLQD